MSLYGVKKSIILLMSIGIEPAAEILKQLTSFEIKKIVKSMVNITHISSEEIHEIKLELQGIIDPIQKIDFDKTDYVFLMLKKAFGENQANAFLEEVIEINDIYSMIKQFNIMKVHELFQLIKNENLQIIAIIMMHISSYQAAHILELFSTKQRFKIMLKIATFKGIQQSGKVELMNIIRSILKQYQYILNNKEGIKVTAKILNLMNITYERSIIHEFSEYSKNLTEKILNEMMLFKNIIYIEDKHISCVLKNITIDDICIALSNVDNLLKEKFIKNMSKNDIIYLKKYLSKKIVLSISKIENVQKNILKQVKLILDQDIFVEENGK